MPVNEEHVALALSVFTTPVALAHVAVGWAGENPGPHVNRAIAWPNVRVPDEVIRGLEMIRLNKTIAAGSVTDKGWHKGQVKVKAIAE